MTHLTSSSPSRRPRWLGLFAGTAFPGRALRISHVHCVALMTCRALRPRGCPTPLPKTQCRMVSSGEFSPSTIPDLGLTGLYHFSPKAYGLSPLCLRLTPHRYPYRPKTRYQVRWVPASWAALSAASKTAPRGAQIRTYRILNTPLLAAGLVNFFREHAMPSNKAVVIREFGSQELSWEEVPLNSPGQREIAIRMRAVSLNYRDYATINGNAPGVTLPLIPLSDGVRSRRRLR